MRSKRLSISPIVVLAVATAVGGVGAQEQEGPPVYRAGVEFVVFNVAVLDDGEAVTGLGPADFRVFEDGRPQEIRLFAGSEDTPLDVALLQEWPAEVASNREDAYDQLRIVLEELDGPGSVLISSQLLAVDEANEEMAGYNLIRHSQLYGINDDSVGELLDYVRAQQDAGATVYYHYTEFEDVSSNFRRYELGFDAYFERIEQEFSARELVRAESPWRVQRLYIIGASESIEATTAPTSGP